MKKAIIIAAFLTASLFGQQAQPQEPTPEQLKALVVVLRQQRDQATQTLQDTQAQLALVSTELEAAKKQIAEAAKAKAPAQPSK